MDSDSEYLSRRRYLETISAAITIGVPTFLYAEENDEAGSEDTQYGMDCNDYSVTCAGEPEKFPELENSSKRSGKFNQSVLEQNNSE